MLFQLSLTRYFQYGAQRGARVRCEISDVVCDVSSLYRLFITKIFLAHILLYLILCSVIPYFSTHFLGVPAILKLTILMKLLVLGHSYVRDLATLGVNNLAFGHTSIDVTYSAHPGAGYDKFLENPTLLTESLECKPDIVVVILGGNSILRDVTNFELFHKCRTFYELLRRELPQATIIAAQIELRFFDEPNRFGVPRAEIFKKRRNELNKYLNRLKLKNNMLIIAGPGRLDHKEHNRDEVHLNRQGLRVYMSILKSTVLFVLDNRKFRQ